MILKGYKRENGTFGIRNKLIVLSTVTCTNSIVEQIALLDKEVVPIIHQHGCDHTEKDRTQVLRTLVGTCNNPNVGGILLIGLGCESISVDDIVSRIDTKDKIVRFVIIQETGGDKEELIELAKELLREMKEHLSLQKREEFILSSLVVGLQCGASDPFSGITANPATGLVSDKLVQLGATVVLAEIPEMIGAEKILIERTNNQEVREKLLARINEYIKIAQEFGSDLLGVNPTPGNVKSGISTIEEKSLGSIAKGGNSIIQEFVKYAGRPKSKGLVVMDTPGNDPESITGIAAAGAHVILFTTGLGTPIGNPVVPVIKIASTSKVFNRMKSYMDINAGEIINGVELSFVADTIFYYLIDICNGKETSSEKNNQIEFAINRIGPTF